MENVINKLTKKQIIAISVILTLPITIFPLAYLAGLVAGIVGVFVYEGPVYFFTALLAIAGLG